MLKVHATFYQLEKDAPWLLGIRVGTDVIISKDGIVLEEVWDLQDAYHHGCFTLTP